MANLMLCKFYLKKTEKTNPTHNSLHPDTGRAEHATARSELSLLSDALGPHAGPASPSLPRAPPPTADTGRGGE